MPARCWDAASAARTAVCTTSVTPHRLRHTFATTMLRLGVSLPALMQLLGHKDIHMTLLYYVQKVDMCSGCPKSPIVNARAWLDSA